MGLFDKLTDKVKKVVDTAQQAVGNISAQQVQQDTAQNKGDHTIYEAFSPIYGMGVKFVFTESSLIYGGTEYPYTSLSEITMVSAPQPLTNGVAQVNANGKVLTLAYDNSQKERFAESLSYANEQINKAQSNPKNYKYVLQTYQGTKLEVYEDYLYLYHVPSGMSSLIQNSMRGGAVEIIMQFPQVSLQLSEGSENNLLINYNGQEYLLSVPDNKLSMTQEIISFVENAKTTVPASYPDPAGFDKTWSAQKGSSKQFTLCGESFEITADMDLFNTYRLMFKEYARNCTDCARSEYDKKVRNLTTFLDIFPAIYGYYLATMCDKAMQLVVAEGLWSITGSTFLEEHLSGFHLAPDAMDIMAESIALTLEQNANTIAGAMNYVPTLRGGGFGIKGALKGIAGATAFNAARDSVESSLLQGACALNQAQQAELFNRINPDILFADIYADYWNMFLTFVCALKGNGVNIWWISDEDAQTASNIFTNLSNPNFPQEQLLPVFIRILQTNPYNEEYISFMLKRFGKTAETEAIINYFGYTELL